MRDNDKTTEPEGGRQQSQPPPQGSGDTEAVPQAEEVADNGSSGNEKEAEETVSGRVEHDLEQLIAKASERDEYLALAQRTQADFDNYRKRVARERSVAESRGVARTVKELLPALDSLDRAVEPLLGGEQTQAATDPSELAAGLKLLRDEFHAALGRLGVEPFSPYGEPFDPEHHEAMVKQPAEGVTSGHVAEVYQCGYRLDGTVLRPARVVVAE